MTLKLLLLTFVAFTSAFPLTAPASDTLPGLASQPATYFYTGKPYDSDMEGYIFNYRTYSPAMGRWTTSDPSGFPDGANNQSYAAAPTNQLDALGLRLNIGSAPSGATYYGAIASDIAAWNLGYAAAGNLQTTAMTHAESGANWSLNATEIAAVRGTSIYSTFRSDVQTVADVYFTAMDNGTYPFSTGPTNYTFPRKSDPYYAFGDVRLATSGGGVVDHSGGIGTNTWSYYATVTLSDVFTFAGYAGVPWYTPTGVGFRLQSHGWILPFNTSGSWSDTWSAE